MRLYDTFSRGPVELPAPPGPVRMYFCGPTVYARAHVGNARPFLLGMWLRSWLRVGGYDVTLVHNITDVNDKIYDAAPGASAELAERATQWYLEDVGGFGLGLPDHLPKATGSIREIVAFVEELVAAGFAYAVDGDVYFRVARAAGYGRLSGQRPDQVEEQEPNPLKEDGRDFALWKANKPGVEDTWWESPWGPGRPGWHIECSAMAEAAFGPAFEIHGGGLDLVFPHHENELAQSRALGHPFAALWAHNGMLRFTGEKMSKSLGNVTTLRDALDRFGAKPLLLFFLTGHWRKPLDFNDDVMASAASQWAGFEGSFRVPRSDPPEGEWRRFAAALDDDFNTPEALAILHGWRARGYWELVRDGLAIFGLDLPPAPAGPGAPAEVEELARRRETARAAKDFAEADRLRAAIDELGFEVQDGAGGPRLIAKP